MQAHSLLIDAKIQPSEIIQSTDSDHPDSKELSSITEKEFIQQFYLNSNSSISTAFWMLAEGDQGYLLDQIFDESTQCSPDYSNESIHKVAKLVAAKNQLLTQTLHALGIQDYFPEEDKFLYWNLISKLFLKFEPYENSFYNICNTFYSNVNKSANIAFSVGYYNVPLQKSLIDSFRKFTKQQLDDKQQTLEKVLDSLEFSTQYYDEYYRNNELPIHRIRADLEAGNMRVFSVGRTMTGGFHAFNIIIHKNYLVICDRYDKDSSCLIRKKDEGIFVYDFKKSFSNLSLFQKAELLFQLSHDVLKEFSLSGFTQLLEVDQPLIILPAKNQTKGNCRYASKKLAVCGAIFLALLDEITPPLTQSNIEKIYHQALHLQKQFTEFDRLNKIDIVIDSVLLRPEEKEELLFLALLKNNDPNHKADQKIWCKIINYYKNSPDSMDHLFVLIKQLMSEISQIADEQNKWKVIKSLHDTITLMKINHIDCSILYAIDNNNQKIIETIVMIEAVIEIKNNISQNTWESKYSSAYILLDNNSSMKVPRTIEKIWTIIKFAESHFNYTEAYHLILSIISSAVADVNHLKTTPLKLMAHNTYQLSQFYAQCQLVFNKAANDAYSFEKKVESVEMKNSAQR